MHYLNLFSDFSFFAILTLILFAFSAGFIDAVVGGGGLIQLPAMLISLPKANVLSILGTGKIASLCGTSVAAFQYSKKIKFNFKLLSLVASFAAIAAFFGAKLVSQINVNTLKPLILLILIIIAIYTFLKKDLGSLETKQLQRKKQYFLGSLIGFLVGFYDGFFGPGTGSFFVLGFVTVLGFDFIKASAYAKMVNCMTNIAALFVFVRQGNFILHIALTMALFNVLGNIVGARLALKKGNEFVRKIFLFIVILMIIRYGFDVFNV